MIKNPTESLTADIPTHLKSNDTPTRRFFGLTVKKETTCANAFAIFYLHFVNIASSAFVNSQMIFLLKSEDHFAISQHDIGRATSRLVFVLFIFSMIFSPMFGYIFDLFGRRKPILISMLFKIVVVLFLPYTSPNFILLVAGKVLFGLMSLIIDCEPLVADYVKNESRGKAIAF